MQIEQGFRAEHRAEAAGLFWQAFAAKLGLVLGPEARALGFLQSALDPSHAVCALDAQGRLLGVAGFKTANGALVNADWPMMRAHYGRLGAAWRAALLALLERPLIDGQLLMDGIFVASRARGQGVGTALLRAVYQTARDRGCQQVRLDVIDGNTGAHKLYLREGFVAEGHERTGPLRYVFGFSGATRMVRALD